MASWRPADPDRAGGLNTLTRFADTDWATPMGRQVDVDNERRKHGADAVGYSLTHGRHCACTPCREQDWDEPGLAPCGMHGDACCGDPGDCNEPCTERNPA